MPLIRMLLSLTLIVTLSACKSDVLSPSGYIAGELRDVLLITTLMIFVIVGPVLVALVAFGRKYSVRNGSGAYDKHFHHSSKLELLIWAAPLMIVIWLGAITWVSTHKLDPYRPLDTEAAGVAADTSLLNVQVVSLDWKWLFIYPDHGIAVVNESAAPLNHQIRFDMTSAEVMNAFYIPAIAGMIYTMPSMQTQLHAVVNEPGVFPGRSSHYSGAGFSQMQFLFHGLSDDDFKAWVEKVRAEGKPLDRETYKHLAKASIADPVQYFILEDKTLYHDIMNRCVEEGQTCLDAHMQHAGHDSASARGDARAEDTKIALR